MKCPFCEKNETKVTDKRETVEQGVTRRRRECLKCSKRFTTYERVETMNLGVIKKKGYRESFDKEKLRRGLLKACEKRPVTLEQVDEVVERIVSELRKLKTTDVKSDQIGKKVVQFLKKLDEVAYLRFASVYRDFEGVKDFEKEIKEIKK